MVFQYSLMGLFRSKLPFWFAVETDVNVVWFFSKFRFEDLMSKSNNSIHKQIAKNVIPFLSNCSSRTYVAILIGWQWRKSAFQFEFYLMYHSHGLKRFTKVFIVKSAKSIWLQWNVASKSAFHSFIFLLFIFILSWCVNWRNSALKNTHTSTHALT